jgi:hypothetical protein
VRNPSLRPTLLLLTLRSAAAALPPPLLLLLSNQVLGLTNTSKWEKAKDMRTCIRKDAAVAGGSQTRGTVVVLCASAASTPTAC